LKQFQQKGKSKASEISVHHPSESGENEKKSSNYELNRFSPSEEPDQQSIENKSAESSLEKQLEKLQREHCDLLTSQEQLQISNNKLEEGLKETISDKEELLLSNQNLHRELEDKFRSSQELSSLCEETQELNRKLKEELQGNLISRKEAEKIAENRESELKRTIAILIEEKNDLIGAAQQFKDTIEHLNNELKGKQGSVETLNSQLMNSESLAEENKFLKQELVSKNELYNDVCDEHTELKIRCENQMKSLHEKEDLNKQLNAELELVKLNMQQLKNDDSTDNVQKEQDSQNEITELRLQLDKVNVEKDVLTQQYQQYILRLNVQLRSVNSQVESIVVEKKNIEAVSQVHVERIAELEAVVADLKSREVSQVVEEVTKPTEMETQSSAERDDLQRKVTELSCDNEQLGKLVEEKESRIQELEIRVDRMQSELELISSSNNDAANREKLLRVTYDYLI